MKRTAVVCSLLLFLHTPLAAQTPMFSLWADEDMTLMSVYADSFETYSFYVFLAPGADGAFGAEYKLTGVEGHFCIESLANTFVSGSALGTPYGPPGISVSFTSCQTETVWIYRHTVLVLPPVMSGVARLDPNDDTGFLGIAECPEPRLLVEAWVYNQLEVNNYWCEGQYPVLQSVEVVAADSLVARFSPCPEQVYVIDSDNFLLYSNTEPPETIGVIPPSWADCETPLALGGDLVPGTEYTLEAIDVCGLGWYGACCNSSSAVFTWSGTTSVIETVPPPLFLEPNHPNPFNPSTRIGFTLPAAGEISLEIFDAAGRRVRTIERGILPAGRHEAAWDGLDDRGGNLPSGVYFARLQTGKIVLSRKMVLLR